MYYLEWRRLGKGIGFRFGGGGVGDVDKEARWAQQKKDIELKYLEMTKRFDERGEIRRPESVAGMGRAREV